MTALPVTEDSKTIVKRMKQYLSDNNVDWLVTGLSVFKNELRNASGFSASSRSGDNRDLHGQ